MNSTGEWCPFEHINVGHELTKNTSRVHACFPAAPPEMEIEIPCPNNSTAYYWDRKIKHLTRKCQKNGTWATHEGHCGCHYDIFKWDRVAFYFSGFQKFKVLLGMVIFRNNLSKKYHFWCRRLILTTQSHIFSIIIGGSNNYSNKVEFITLYKKYYSPSPGMYFSNRNPVSNQSQPSPKPDLTCNSVCGMSFIQHNRFGSFYICRRCIK